MDGLLLVDKPAGPTSHDIVARLRRTSGERSVGHTGTLDPRATGLLPLVFGRATRLASLLSAGDKTYEASIRLGFATTTDDAAGEPIDGDPSSPVAAPDARTIRETVAQFTGTFDQVPPSHSAKKVQGRRAYELARGDRRVALPAARVTVRRLDVIDLDGDRVDIVVTATAGFYVRALARDLGRALGCGAHLAALRRTRSGTFDVEAALPLEDLERAGLDVARHLLAPSAALPELAAVTATEAGLRRVVHGNPLSPEHLEDRWLPATSGPTTRPVKVLDHSGWLVALAQVRGGSLHPVVVLGYH